MNRIEDTTVSMYLERTAALLTKTIRNTASSKQVGGYLMRKIADALEADLYRTSDISLFIAPLQRAFFVEQAATVCREFNEGRFGQDLLISNIISLLSRCTCAPELASKTQCLRLEAFMAAINEYYTMPESVRSQSIVAWRTRQALAAA